MFDFKKQLKVGERGEELFMDHYPKKLEVHPENDGDFIEVNSRRKIELKTDTYNITKTPNFFFERWSVFHPNPLKRKVGGPWQAYEHGCDTFCYMFVRHNIWYQFDDIEALTSRLNTLTEGKGLVYVKNRGYITAGYPIERKLFDDLFNIYEF